jgi:hypothetical protein
MAYQSYPYHAPAQSYGGPPPVPGPSYYTPPPAQHYQPVPPPVAAPHDPFRAYYADRLMGLTFNSRPLIQELSILAMQQRDQNQWGNMTAVVEEIEGAVYRVCRAPLSSSGFLCMSWLLMRILTRSSTWFRADSIVPSTRKAAQTLPPRFHLEECRRAVHYPFAPNYDPAAVHPNPSRSRRRDQGQNGRDDLPLASVRSGRN